MLCMLWRWRFVSYCKTIYEKPDVAQDGLCVRRMLETIMSLWFSTASRWDDVALSLGKYASDNMVLPTQRKELSIPSQKRSRASSTTSHEYSATRSINYNSRPTWHNPQKPLKMYLVVLCSLKGSFVKLLVCISLFQDMFLQFFIAYSNPTNDLWPGLLVILGSELQICGCGVSNFWGPCCGDGYQMLPASL